MLDIWESKCFTWFQSNTEDEEWITLDGQLSLETNAFLNLTKSKYFFDHANGKIMVRKLNLTTRQHK